MYKQYINIFLRQDKTWCFLLISQYFHLCISYISFAKASLFTLTSMIPTKRFYWHKISWQVPVKERPRGRCVYKVVVVVYYKVVLRKFCAVGPSSSVKLEIWFLIYNFAHISRFLDIYIYSQHIRNFQFGFYFPMFGLNLYKLSTIIFCNTTICFVISATQKEMKNIERRELKRVKKVKLLKKTWWEDVENTS